MSRDREPRPPELEEQRGEQRGEQAQRGEEEQRESGRPGSGRDRRDEVGRTGVFPASRPEGASPDAPYHGEKSWGQGERGEAGYEDHGDSEVFVPPLSPEELAGRDSKKSGQK